MRVRVEKAVRVPMRPDWLRRVLIEAASQPEITARLGADPSLTLRLTGDRELRRLNGRFLGEDAATDVLSFPAGQLSLEPGYLGDLAISWPAVLRQSSAFGHSVQAELALLSVHGLLHLLGWDHGDPSQELEMSRLTRLALSRSRIEIAPGRL